MQLAKSPDDLTMRVAAEVRAVMARQMINQQTLADRVGVTQSYLARRLVGRVPFDISDLERVAAALGVTVLSLIPASVERAA